MRPNFKSTAVNDHKLLVAAVILGMAVNSTKFKPPDLSPTPEETSSMDGDTGDRTTRSAVLPNNRSGLNLHLQERLLSCGNYTALLDDEDRMGRRPSVGSLSMDGGGGSGSARDRESDDGSYFSIKRVRISVQFVGNLLMWVCVTVAESEESTESSTRIDTFTDKDVCCRRSGRSRRTEPVHSRIIQHFPPAWQTTTTYACIMTCIEG